MYVFAKHCMWKTEDLDNLLAVYFEKVSFELPSNEQFELSRTLDLNNVEITFEVILNKVNSLKSSTHPSSGKIPVLFLKSCVKNLVFPLQKWYCYSLDKWKKIVYHSNHQIVIDRILNIIDLCVWRLLNVKF